MKKIYLLLFWAISPLLTWGASYYYIWIDGICYDLESNSKTGSKAVVRYASQGYDYNEEYGYVGDITIPETVVYNGTTFTVTAISDNAFKNCHELTSVKIIGGVESIGTNAFANCENLTYIYIPSSVKTIGEQAFVSSGIGTIDIQDLTAWCEVDFECIYSSHRLLLNGEEITDLIIPEGISKIKRGPFSYCSNLTSISMPNSVVEIEDFAFQDCRNVRDVHFSNSIKRIGCYAFANCCEIES